MGVCPQRGTRQSESLDQTLKSRWLDEQSAAQNDPVGGQHDPFQVETARVESKMAWRLGECSFDMDAQLLCDCENRPIALRRQSVKVLALLLRHRGQLVTKEQLLAEVWPGVIVTDASIAQAVSDLREALGPRARHLVRSLARQGYTLVDEMTAATAHPLPLPCDDQPLFGRADEIDQIDTLLRSHRLVSIVGISGVGKTAVALATARRAAQGGARVGWAAMEGLDDPSLLASSWARALGLPISPRENPVPGLLLAAENLDALLVLDAVECLDEPTAALAHALLGAAPHLRLLVTGQGPLHLACERVMRLAPLPLPDATWSLPALRSAAAVQLFVDRARALDHRFALTDCNVHAIARLCRQLDGLPLALRLGASRVHLIGLAGIEVHLEDRLKSFAQTGSDVAVRHRTLQLALQWSYALLSGREQKLFRRLACFVGGFTSALVAAQPASEKVPETLTLLDGLIERSMVVLDPGPPARQRLPENLRQFALQALVEAGERADTCCWHARTMARAMTTAFHASWMTPERAWLECWAPDLDNVRAALRWAIDCQPALAAELVASSVTLFRLLDLRHELRRWAERIAPATVAQLPVEVAARFFIARCQLASSVSAAEAFAHGLAAEQPARASAQPELVYLALACQATTSHVPADTAQRLLVELRSLERPTWPARQRCLRRAAEFAVATVAREHSLAAAAADAGLALAQEAQSLHFGSLFTNWGLVALIDGGHLDAAEERRRAIARQMELAPPGVTVTFFGTAARLALLRGETAAARARLAVMVERCRTLEWLHFAVFADLGHQLALQERRHEDAARLLGYAEMATAQAWGSLRPRGLREHAGEVLLGLLGGRRLQALKAQGRKLDAAAAAAMTLLPVRHGGLRAPLT